MWRVALSLDVLSATQRRLVEERLPGVVVVRDHSWGQVQTTVLEVVADGERYVVKAGGSSDHHIARELRAHAEWLAPWVSRGRAPELVLGDSEAKLVITRFLPGRLVLGDAAQCRPETFRQAGELLALLHGQLVEVDAEHEQRENDRLLGFLERPHRIAPEVVSRVRAIAAGWSTYSVEVVPTHGDWQPRNWLVHQDVVSVIDFGRAALRPAATDLIRLEAQDFRSDPTGDRAAAFVDGYGADPREAETFRRAQLREGVGTAVWAYDVGDEPFEAQGHRMIAEALAHW
jgi:aminoglycoside/choline kinase family phosphotransferase